MSYAKPGFSSKNLAIGLGLAALLTFGAAAAVESFGRPLYRSRAVLLVPFADSEVKMDLRHLALRKPALPVNVIAGLLRNRAVYKRIADETGQREDEVKRSLFILASTRDNRVILTSVGPDPAKSQETLRVALAALNEAYQSRTLTKDRVELAALDKLVSQRLEEVIQVEKDFVTYLQTARAPGDLRSSVPSRAYTSIYQDAVTALGKAEAALSAYQSKAEQAASKGGELPTGLPSLMKLRNSLQTSLAELEELEAYLGPKNPMLVRKMASVSALKELLAKEVEANKLAAQTMTPAQLANLKQSVDLARWQTSRAEELKNIAISESPRQLRLARQLTLANARYLKAGILRGLVDIRAQGSQLQYSVLSEPQPEPEAWNRDQRGSYSAALIAFAVIALSLLKYRGGTSND